MKEEADSPFFFGIRQPLWSDEQLIAEFLKNNMNSKAIWSLNSWKIREANGFRYYVRIVCIKWTYKIKIIYPSDWVQTCYSQWFLSWLFVYNKESQCEFDVCIVSRQTLKSNLLSYSFKARLEKQV